MLKTKMSQVAASAVLLMASGLNGHNTPTKAAPTLVVTAAPMISTAATTAGSSASSSPAPAAASGSAPSTPGYVLYSPLKTYISPDGTRVIVTSTDTSAPRGAISYDDSTRVALCKDVAWVTDLVNDILVNDSITDDAARDAALDRVFNNTCVVLANRIIVKTTAALAFDIKKYRDQGVATPGRYDTAHALDYATVVKVLLNEYTRVIEGWSKSGEACLKFVYPSLFEVNFGNGAGKSVWGYYELMFSCRRGVWSIFHAMFQPGYYSVDPSEHEVSLKLILNSKKGNVLSFVGITPAAVATTSSSVSTSAATLVAPSIVVSGASSSSLLASGVGRVSAPGRKPVRKALAGAFSAASPGVSPAKGKPAGTSPKP